MSLSTDTSEAESVRARAGSPEASPELTRKRADQTKVRSNMSMLR